MTIKKSILPIFTASVVLAAHTALAAQLQGDGQDRARRLRCRRARSDGQSRSSGKRRGTWAERLHARARWRLTIYSSRTALRHSG